MRKRSAGFSTKPIAQILAIFGSDHWKCVSFTAWGAHVCNKSTGPRGRAFSLIQSVSGRLGLERCDVEYSTAVSPEVRVQSTLIFIYGIINRPWRLWRTLPLICTEYCLEPPVLGSIRQKHIAVPFRAINRIDNTHSLARYMYNKNVAKCFFMNYLRVGYIKKPVVCRKDMTRKSFGPFHT